MKGLLVDIETDLKHTLRSIANVFVDPFEADSVLSALANCMLYSLMVDEPIEAVEKFDEWLGNRYPSNNRVLYGQVGYSTIHGFYHFYCKANPDFMNTVFDMVAVADSKDRTLEVAETFDIKFDNGFNYMVIEC